MQGKMQQTVKEMILFWPLLYEECPLLQKNVLQKRKEAWGFIEAGEQSSHRESREMSLEVSRCSEHQR